MHRWAAPRSLSQGSAAGGITLTSASPKLWETSLQGDTWPTHLGIGTGSFLLNLGGDSSGDFPDIALLLRITPAPAISSALVTISPQGGQGSQGAKCTRQAEFLHKVGKGVKVRSVHGKLKNAMHQKSLTVTIVAHLVTGGRWPEGRQPHLLWIP